MNSKLEKVKDILSTYNQEHLLMFYDDLDNNKKELLLEQILRIDFEQILKLYDNSMINNPVSLNDVSPLRHFEKNQFSEDEISYYTKLGENIIKSNTFAVVTMAGGQGTRLRVQRSKRYI